jgi:hypothetical protein
MEVAWGVRCGRCCVYIRRVPYAWGGRRECLVREVVVEEEEGGPWGDGWRWRGGGGCVSPVCVCVRVWWWWWGGGRGRDGGCQWRLQGGGGSKGGVMEAAAGREGGRMGNAWGRAGAVCMCVCVCGWWWLRGGFRGCFKLSSWGNILYIMFARM